MRSALQLIVLVLALALSYSSASAQDQRSFVYEYDEAGNLVSVRAATNSGPPVVLNLDPALVRNDDTVSVVLTGLNLFLAELDPVIVTTLFINNVVHLSDTELSFELDVPNGATGSRQFTVTIFGSAVAEVLVAERLPIVAVNPSPLLITDGESRLISILLDQPYANTVDIVVEVTDSTIASLPGGVDSIQVTIPAGDTEFSFVLFGEAEGIASLTLSQLDNAQLTNVAVLVSAPQPLPEGEVFITTNLIGVRVDPFGRSPERIDSAAVGVRRNILVRSGESIESPLIGVSRRILVRAGESIHPKPVGVEKE